MKVPRLVLATAVTLPLSGCLFAVGSGGDTEALRDRVRALERRVERLEDGDGGPGAKEPPAKRPERRK